MTMHPQERIAVMMKTIARRSTPYRRTWSAWWRNLKTCRRRQREVSCGARSVRRMVILKSPVQRTNFATFVRSWAIRQRNAPLTWKLEDLHRCFSHRRLPCRVVVGTPIVQVPHPEDTGIIDVDRTIIAMQTITIPIPVGAGSSMMRMDGRSYSVGHVIYWGILLGVCNGEYTQTIVSIVRTRRSRRLQVSKIRS